MGSIGTTPPIQQQATVQNTASTGTTGKIKDFFVAIGQGLSKAAGAVANFFTETLPNAFKSLGSRTAEQAVAPTQARDVRATVEDPKPTIDGFSSGLLPDGVKIGADGALSGSVVLTKTSANGREWAGSIDKAMSDTVQRMIDKPETVTVDGHDIPMGGKSSADLPRMDVTFTGGFNTQGKPIKETAQEMRAFTGSDNATKVLSGAINQYMLRPMEVMPTSGDKIVTFRTASTQMSKTDTTYITNYKHVDSEGVEHTLGKKPSQYGAAKFEVTKDAQGDFHVKVDWDMYVSGFRSQEGMNEAPLGGRDHLMKLNMQTEYVISKEAADRGELDFRLEIPPTVTFSGKLQE